MSIEHRDDTGARFGMWLFLYTEVILFSGLFVLFAMTQARFPEHFAAASAGLNTTIGTLNTFVLLTSSLTLSLSVTALQLNKIRQSLLFCSGTVLLAVIFLVNKYFEWSTEISHGIYPGSDHLAESAPGTAAFFNLYFFTTGLHGLHIFIGIVLILTVTGMIIRGKVSAECPVLLVNSTLYWHLVDLIWIFVFPLFYLIPRGFHG
ncbi:MAG: cytochrome c oxidase subunit 3 [Desulfuromonadales bacterium]|nr:cytochrome c oxidase subunit 3 [Desulfuromonadales bacterium]MBN2791343.1 cytochrome c oxidase subunit 3 [Desulfuromonadales bacterium]